MDGLGNARNGFVPVTDRFVARPFPGNQAEEIRTDVIVLRASRPNAFKIRIGHAALVVVVADQPRLTFSLTIHNQALIVASGCGIRIAQTIEHGEQGAVFPNHAAVRPQVSFVAVGKSSFDPVHGHFHRFQSGNEVNQVNVMATNIGKGVSVIASKPVLKIGEAVIVRLNELGLAQDKGAELAPRIAPLGHQGSPVKAFVVLDAHQAALLSGQLLDFNCLFVLEN
jgi:hypothetical protein